MARLPVRAVCGEATSTRPLTAPLPLQASLPASCTWSAETTAGALPVPRGRPVEERQEQLAGGVEVAAPNEVTTAIPPLHPAKCGGVMTTEPITSCVQTDKHSRFGSSTSGTAMPRWLAWISRGEARPIQGVRPT